MDIIDYKDIDFVNYKQPSLYVIMPYCSFKCDYECGREVCQNSSLVYQDHHDISNERLTALFDANPITKAIVFAGLEPFDTNGFESFIDYFRKTHNDTIVIYTGYTENEIHEWEPWIYKYSNIIIKFGRFIPDQEPHYDEVLGVTLASPNQYAKEINNE